VFISGGNPHIASRFCGIMLGPATIFKMVSEPLQDPLGHLLWDFRYRAIHHFCPRSKPNNAGREGCVKSPTSDRWWSDIGLVKNIVKIYQVNNAHFQIDRLIWNRRSIEFGPTFFKAWLLASSTIKSNKKCPYRICKHAKVQDFGSLSTHNLFFKSTSIDTKVQTKNYINKK